MVMKKSDENVADNVDVFGALFALHVPHVLVTILKVRLILLGHIYLDFQYVQHIFPSR
jgi:hypothetical protein